MKLIETKNPRTKNGNEYNEWAKYLIEVKKTAKNGNDFDGEWAARGAVATVPVGTVLLECAGYKTYSDKERNLNRLMVLWELTEGGWEELVSSKDRGWALEFREVAISALERNQPC